jgi:hypothetical protein
MNGLTWNDFDYLVVAFVLIVGRRVLANHLIRRHPEWSPEKKSAVQRGLAIAIIVIFGVMLVATSRS